MSEWRVFVLNWVSMLALEVEQLQVLKQSFDYHTQTSSYVPFDETFVVSYVPGRADDSSDYFVALPSHFDDSCSLHVEALMMQNVDFVATNEIVALTLAALHETILKPMLVTEDSSKDAEVGGSVVVVAAVDGFEVLVVNEIVEFAEAKLAAIRQVLGSSNDYIHFDQVLYDYNLDVERL